MESPVGPGIERSKCYYTVCRVGHVQILHIRVWEYILCCCTLNLPLQASSIPSKKTPEEREYVLTEEGICAFGMYGCGTIRAGCRLLRFYRKGSRAADDWANCGGDRQPCADDDCGNAHGDGKARQGYGFRGRKHATAWDQPGLQPVSGAGSRPSSFDCGAADPGFASLSLMAHARPVCRPLRHGRFRPRESRVVARRAGILH